MAENLKQAQAKRQELREQFSLKEVEISNIANSIDGLVYKYEEQLISKMKTKDQVFYKKLKSYNRGSAFEWLKTKVALQKGLRSYTSTVPSIKRQLGYGTHAIDPLVQWSEEFKRKIRNAYSVTVTKAPLSSSSHIGVEIECFIEGDRSSLQRSFADYCFKNKIKGAMFKSDGSISPDEDDHSGVEITVTCPKDNVRELELVCQWLADYEAKVNSSCGLHVHLDFRNRDDLELAAGRLTKALPYLSQLVPRSRRNNSYCALKRNYLDRGDRYCAVNVHSFRKFKTLEVRLHSGTTQFRKIVNWVIILHNIIDNAAFTKHKPDVSRSIDTFIELLNFPTDSVNYYIYERWKRFNSPNSSNYESGIE